MDLPHPVDATSGDGEVLGDAQVADWKSHVVEQKRFIVVSRTRQGYSPLTSSGAVRRTASRKSSFPSYELGSERLDAKIVGKVPTDVVEVLSTPSPVVRPGDRQCLLGVAHVRLLLRFNHTAMGPVHTSRYLYKLRLV